VHSMWYVDRVKVVPRELADYLTPRALAIWIMDDGTWMGSGVSLCTNGFTHEECLYLAALLSDKFGLRVSVIGAGAPDQFRLYIWKRSVPLLREVVMPFMHPTMAYKLGPDS
jgi:ubiquinol-cytochrome c reductase cytochrome b subunit